MTVYRFDNDDVPMWQSMLAWAVLIALLGLFLKCCVEPVLRPIGEALVRQAEEEKAKGAK